MCTGHRKEQDRGQSSVREGLVAPRSGGSGMDHMASVILSKHQPTPITHSLEDGETGEGQGTDSQAMPLSFHSSIYKYLWSSTRPSVRHEDYTDE